MKFVSSLPEFSGIFEKAAESRRPDFIGQRWYFCQVYHKWMKEPCGCPQPPFEHDCGGSWE